MSNPIFGSNFYNSAQAQASLSKSASNLSAEELENLYAQPSATSIDTDRMTYDDVIVRTLGIFGLLLVGAFVGWMMPQLAIAGAIVGFVLAMVNIFRKKISPALILAYAAAQGVFLGGITGLLEAVLPGIAIQALLGTGAVFGTVLVLFANGKVRTSPKLTKIFMVAIIGYLAFSLVNVVLMWTGVSTDPWGLRTGLDIAGIPLGVIIGALAILLASYSLVMDFEVIKAGVEHGAPKVFAWKASFGLTVTLIWLYVEILRLLAILRGGD